MQHVGPIFLLATDMKTAAKYSGLWLLDSCSGLKTCDHQAPTSTCYSNRTRIFLHYSNPTQKFLKNNRVASSMYLSLFRKIAASLIAKTILIDTALASNPSKEQEFHPQRRKCRSMSKRNNSSEINTIGVVGRNADVLYFNWRHCFLAVLTTTSV